LHRAFWRQFITHQQMHCYIVIVYNLYNKTFKTLLHVSILRSSIQCSLLKLYVKKLITRLYVSVMRQHIVCMCLCCISCREVGRPTSLQEIQHTHIHSICCCITETYNLVLNFIHQLMHFYVQQNVSLICSHSFIQYSV